MRLAATVALSISTATVITGSEMSRLQAVGLIVVVAVVGGILIAWWVVRG